MKSVIYTLSIVVILSNLSCKSDFEAELYELEDQIDLNDQQDYTELAVIEEAIQGKWVLLQCSRSYTEGIQNNTPTGYVEYLSDGHFAWYDFKTKKYTLYEGKYWIDSIFNKPISQELIDFYCWVLHYENSKIFSEESGGYLYKYTYHLDIPLYNQFAIRFIDKNTFSLDGIELVGYIALPSYIYKRIK